MNHLFINPFLPGRNTLVFGLVYNPWLHNRCYAGAGMVVRFFIFNSNRRRKLGAGNRNEVLGLQEKGKRSYYSRDAHIGYRTGRFKPESRYQV
jgi:hypothetical protein